MRVTRFSDLELLEFPSLMIPRLIIEVGHRSLSLLDVVQSILAP